MTQILNVKPPGWFLFRFSRDRIKREAGAHDTSHHIDLGRDGHRHRDGLRVPRVVVIQMTALILASTKRYFGFGDQDDRVVLYGGRVIGRIFLSSQAPADRNWMWTITVMDYPRTIHSRGYSATREQAMTEFKNQWLAAG